MYKKLNPEAVAKILVLREQFKKLDPDERKAILEALELLKVSKSDVDA